GSARRLTLVEAPRSIRAGSPCQSSFLGVTLSGPPPACLCSERDRLPGAPAVAGKQQPTRTVRRSSIDDRRSVDHRTVGGGGETEISPADAAIVVHHGRRPVMAC